MQISCCGKLLDFFLYNFGVFFMNWGLVDFCVAGGVKEGKKTVIILSSARPISFSGTTFLCFGKFPLNQTELDEGRSLSPWFYAKRIGDER